MKKVYEYDSTLISRRSERDGSLRVEAHIYGIDICVFGKPNFGLTMPQARILLERLQQAIQDVEETDETTFVAPKPQHVAAPSGETDGPR